MDRNERFVGGEGHGARVHDDEGGLDRCKCHALGLYDVANLLLHVLIIITEVGRVFGQSSNDSLQVIIHNPVLY